MNRSTIDFRISIQTLVRALLTEPSVLRIGISGEPDCLRYVLITRRVNEDPIPVAWGMGIPLWLRLFLPVVVCADTGFLPVQLITETITDEDPATWIDRKEDTVLPAGFCSKSIDTDWVIDNTDVIAFTAVTEARDNLCRILERQVVVGALMPPLSGYAAAYRSAIDSVCIVWKIDTRGSILGRMVGGKLQDVCHFWVTIETIRENPNGVAETVLPLMYSLGSEGITPLPVLLLTFEDALPENFKHHLPNCQLITNPLISGLPPIYHEAYGNALESMPVAQLLPFDKRKKAEGMLRAWQSIWSVIRGIIVVLVILMVVGGLYIGLGTFIIHRDRETIHNIDNKFATIVKLEHLRDSLMNNFNEHAASIEGESSLTLLLRDMQEAVPQGVAIEEISIVERNITSWNLLIRVLAKSSTLLQPMLNGLINVEGIHDVRIVYSEQVDGNLKRKGVKFKVEAIWR